MRSKYINTFDTTAEYNAYIESAVPEFPNVGYDKQAGEVNIMRTSPNSHLIYGELIENYTATPVFTYNWVGSSYKKSITHIDTLTNTFYLDSSDLEYTITNMYSALAGNVESSVNNNIKSIKKMNIDLTNVSSLADMFNYCSNLEYVNFSGVILPTTINISELFRYCSKLKVIDFSGVTITSSNNTSTMFSGTNLLTDIYITEEDTLNKLTNNLSSRNDSYVPQQATIHYNSTDYKWQNNAWTAQS